MFIYYDVMCDYSQISVCPVSGDKTNIELGWAGLCWARQHHKMLGILPQPHQQPHCTLPRIQLLGTA